LRLQIESRACSTKPVEQNLAFAPEGALDGCRLTTRHVGGQQWHSRALERLASAPIQE